jgi:hypothetical protein
MVPISRPILFSVFIGHNWVETLITPVIGFAATGVFVAAPVKIVSQNISSFQTR